MLSKTCFWKGYFKQKNDFLFSSILYISLYCTKKLYSSWIVFHIPLILDIITWFQISNRLDSNKGSKHKYAWCHFSAKTDFKHFNLHNVLMKTQLCSLGHHILLLFHPYRLSKYNVSWIRTQPCTIIIFTFTSWRNFIMMTMKW